MVYTLLNISKRNLSGL